MAILPAGVNQSANQAFVRETQGNELASTHLGRLLQPGNEYTDNARRRGYEFAANRGLGNSSIAAGASQRAAIEAAAPIAAQDASAFGQAASENLAFLNQRDIFNQEDATRRYVADTQAGAQISVANINAATSRDNLARQLEFNGQQADLDRMHSITMQNLGFDQDLQRMAASHGMDLDRLSAQSFYNIQEMAALDDLNVRDQGMAFMMGVYNNYTTMMNDAMTGDYDAAAQSRLFQQNNNYLQGSISFGRELFSNFPSFSFDFQNYGG